MQISKHRRGLDLSSRAGTPASMTGPWVTILVGGRGETEAETKKQGDTEMEKEGERQAERVRKRHRETERNRDKMGRKSAG